MQDTFQVCPLQIKGSILNTPYHFIQVTLQMHFHPAQALCFLTEFLEDELKLLDERPHVLEARLLHPSQTALRLVLPTFQTLMIIELVQELPAYFVIKWCVNN